MKNLFLLSILFVLASCSSSKYKVKDIDTKLDVKANMQGSKIGLDEQKQAIIKTEKSTEAELQKQQWTNYDMEKQLANEHAQLTRCRTELADPRLGGTGQVVEIPEIDNMKKAASIKEEIGLDEQGNLKVVKREYYLDRLDRERKYNETLKSMLQIVAKNKATCDREMGYARAKHGLPSERYKAIGHYDNKGTWIMDSPAENSLDDAFKIQAAGAAQATGK
jgi:hypothetical protein